MNRALKAAAKNLKYGTRIICGQSSVEYSMLAVAPDFRCKMVRPDTDIVIEALNRKFGTRFHYETLDPNMEQEIFNRLIDHNKKVNQPNLLVSVPNEEKNKLKRAIVDTICAHSAYEGALEIYTRFSQAQQTSTLAPE